MVKILVGENSAEHLPYWFRSNVHFLFFKTFYDNYCYARAKAVNGKARTYMVGSQPKRGEKEHYSRLPNYRLQLTALAAAAASFLSCAATDRAAAEAER
jgi:hypothetical protein